MQSHDRILVASPDSRFLRVAGFLLDRNGLGVTTTRSTRSDEVSRLVELHRPHLVVLDAGDSAAEAAGVAALIENRHAGVHVLLVSGLPEAHDVVAHRVSVLPKWSFQLLSDEIDRARRLAGADRESPSSDTRLRVVAAP